MFQIFKRITFFKCSFFFFSKLTRIIGFLKQLKISLVVIPILIINHFDFRPEASLIKELKILKVKYLFIFGNQMLSQQNLSELLLILAQLILIEVKLVY